MNRSIEFFDAQFRRQISSADFKLYDHSTNWLNNRIFRADQGRPVPKR